LEIKTKFNIGESVWYDRDNNVNELEVIRCEVMEITYTHQIYYKIKRYGESGLEMNVTEDHLRLTIQEFVEERK
jgi:hypothetical protein